MSNLLHRTVLRTFLSLLLLFLSGAFWWFAVGTNRLAARDLSFLKDHFWLVQPFGDSWLLRGNVAYFGDLDPRAAAADYRQAIIRQPLEIDAWLNLAKAELAEGKSQEARQILGTLSPVIYHVSTWKWQELLLARDLHEETYFSSAFNFIMARLPRRITEGCFLAKGFWGDSGAIIPHLAEENWEIFLKELLRMKDLDAALALWKTMDAGHFPPDKSLRLHFCEVLLRSGKLAAAKEIWTTWRDDGKPTVYDGGFESKPTDKGFGWQFWHHPEVIIERSTQIPYEGSYSLHLRFMGTVNVNFFNVHQKIPVEPGTVYRLRFAHRTDGLTTDQGVFLEVYGYECRGLKVTSEPILKKSPWLKEELLVPVPPGCEAIVLRVCRRESLMFDSKISGDYWLDAIELVRRHDS